jgi:hypothetical protein
MLTHTHYIRHITGRRLATVKSRDGFGNGGTLSGGQVSEVEVPCRGGRGHLGGLHAPESLLFSALGKVRTKCWQNALQRQLIATFRYSLTITIIINKFQYVNVFLTIFLYCANVIYIMVHNVRQIVTIEDFLCLRQLPHSVGLLVFAFL